MLGRSVVQDTNKLYLWPVHRALHLTRGSAVTDLLYLLFVALIHKINYLSFNPSVLEMSAKLPPTWTEQQALHLHQGSWSSKFAFHSVLWVLKWKYKVCSWQLVRVFFVMAWKVLDSIDVAEWGMWMFRNDSAKIGASDADNKNNINPVNEY